MHHSKIHQKEAKFKSGSISQFNMQPFSLPIPDSDEKLSGFVCRPAAGYTNYFYPEEVKKDQIVLHHTAGNLQGDFWALTRENWHVSVAFLIARDGTIYQLHGSNQWSHHLGPKALGGNVAQSKRSIGIELSNYGYLEKVGSNLETPYSKVQRDNGKSPDVYCSIQETDLYVKLPVPYRGQRYFATFTDAQYKSLSLLIRYLCATYKIPIAFLPDNERYNLTHKVVGFKGIVSHVNYRKDKWDLGPAFDWARLMAALNKKRGKLDQLQKRLKKAQADYDKAVAVFRDVQLKVWSSGRHSKMTARQLQRAKLDVLTAHTELAEVQDLITEALENKASLMPKTRSMHRVHNSEKEIIKAFPYVRTRGVSHYGEDGPEEMDLSEFYL